MRRWLSNLNVVLAIALVLGALGPAVVSARTVTGLGKGCPGAHQGASVTVIVRRAANTGDCAERCVRRLGGHVTTRLGMIDGFVATVPSDAIAHLKMSPAVRSVSRDVRLAKSSFGHSRGWSPADEAQWYGTTATKSKTPDVFLDTTRVDDVWRLWHGGHRIKGEGVRIAVIDSGVSDGPDLRTIDKFASTSRLVLATSFVASEPTPADLNGHGTHVAGIAAGDGSGQSGRFSGIAPEADVISLKASDAQGCATSADVLEALQWVYDNHAKYDIRVVNLSFNATTPESYKDSPIDAACEILWFNGVVVVASAGNTGPGGVTIDSAPANDPFIITVGATDENYTADRSDDTIAVFSASGVTSDGFRKPDVCAPGRNITSVLSKDSSWKAEYPDRLDSSGKYFRMSGTSMSAPMVTGIVALMLQADPGLTPDEVKYRITHQATAIEDAAGVSYPYVDAYDAITSRGDAVSNVGITMSALLTTGDAPVLTSSVMWRSVMWNSVMWNSVMWRSVMWDSVMWRSGVPLTTSSLLAR